MPLCILKEGFRHLRKEGTATVLMEPGEEVELSENGYKAFKERFDLVEEPEEADAPKKTRPRRKKT